jgi:hypothetical protein
LNGGHDRHVRAYPSNWNRGVAINQISKAMLSDLVHVAVHDSSCGWSQMTARARTGRLFSCRRNGRSGATASSRWVATKDCFPPEAVIGLASWRALGIFVVLHARHNNSRAIGRRKRRERGDGACCFKNASGSRFPERSKSIRYSSELAIGTVVKSPKTVNGTVVKPPQPAIGTVVKPPKAPTVPLSTPQNPPSVPILLKLQRREQPSGDSGTFLRRSTPPWPPRSSTRLHNRPDIPAAFNPRSSLGLLAGSLRASGTRARGAQIVTAGPIPEGTSAGHGTRPIRAGWRSVVRSGSIPRRGGG